MEHLYIVVKKLASYQWFADSVFATRRLAENFIECKQALDNAPKWEWAIVDGPVCLVPPPVVEPAAADLDAVAAEQRIAEQTGESRGI